MESTRNWLIEEARKRNRHRPLKVLAEMAADFETVKEHICYKLVNTNRNKELLKSSPHISYLDLAIVFYIPVAVKDSSGISIPVDNALMKIWGKQVNEIFETAHANTEKIFPAIIEAARKAPEYSPNSGNTGKRDAMYIASNSSKFNGASAILYDGFLHSFADHVGCGLFLMPISMDEVVILPDNGEIDVQMLREIQKEISNDSAADLEPALSEKIYYFDPEDGQTWIV